MKKCLQIAIRRTVHIIGIFTEMKNGVCGLKQTIALVKEDQEKFIFEAIVPFLAEINEIVIPKRVLERALFTFKEEHTAEWKVLMKEYGGTLV